MHVSRYTDYAYRILLYLAVNNERTSMAKISDYYDISHEHLRKVVHNLSKLGYIQTYTGKSGGMELKKRPEKISLAEIFIEFEGQTPIINCQDTGCPLIPTCTLSRVMAKAQNMFIKELKQHSLADLLDNPKMTRLLTSK